jgi:ABC-type transporter Mla subunit MlaD
MNEVSVNSQSAVDMSIREMIDKSRREARENNDALERTLQRYSENINQQVESICQRVESSAVNMAEAGASGSQQLLTSIQQVTESLHQSVSTVVSQTGLASEKLTGELTSVLESNRSTASTLSQAQAAIESSLVVWSQGTEQMRLIVPPLQGTVSELGRTVDNLNAASEGARESQQQVREILSGASGELARLQEMKQSSESLLQEHRRVFDVVESGLAGALTAITDKIENLQAVSARGLNDQLQTFDNHLGTAVGKLGSAVEQLEEALDDAAERIANAGPSAS